jgi:hypothetical protein
MELGHPQVRERLPTQPPTQATEEAVDVPPHHPRVVLTLPPVGEGAETVQPVRRAVTANPAPSTPGRLIRGPPLIRLPLPQPTPTWPRPIQPAERPASLPSLRVQGQKPAPLFLVAVNGRYSFP